MSIMKVFERVACCEIATVAAGSGPSFGDAIFFLRLVLQDKLG
jgi:hypothetical protein